MARLIAPCKNCTDRVVGCHSVCNEYLEYEQERIKQKDMIDREKQLKGQIYSFRSEQIYKAMRSH